MPDYKSMYLKLFNRITDAINILHEGQQEKEKVFIESDDEPILLLPEDKEQSDSRV